MYCVLSFRVTYLFDFCCFGVDDMGGGLKGINHYKRKYYTSLNTCKGPPSLEDEWKPAAARNLASDNSGSEFNNNIVTETDSPSGM